MNKLDDTECRILNNYCTWTRSIWGFMEQSTTILNEANASSRMIQNMQCKPLTWFYVTKHFIEYKIRVITKLPNSEQSYKGKVKNHKCINREKQSTTENCDNRNDPDLVQEFLKKWWVESDFKAPNLSLSLRLKVSGCHYNSIYNNTWTKQVKQLSKQHQAQWSKCERHFYVTHW
jgi:hypothetical protein